MMHCLNHTTLKKLAKRFVYSIALTLLIAGLALAQGVGSTRGLASTGGGSNTIQGRVYFPPGEQNSGKTVKMRLESNSTIGGQSAVTDQDGVFRFNGVAAGEYTVVVDGGKDYENSREPVSITLGSNGRIVQVAIQLKPKVDASNPAFAGVPKPALEAYQKGMAAAQKGDHKAAVTFLNTAVTTAPTFAAALTELGTEYVKLSQWDKAAATFDALVKLKPGDAGAHLDWGIAVYNIGSAQVAEKKEKEAIESLGFAESQFREAIKLNSPGPSAHYYLGMTLVKLRKYDEAQAELEAAVKNGGANIALAHRFLGGLYQRAHRDKEAADEFETYLKLDPGVKDAEVIKGMIQKLRAQ